MGRNTIGSMILRPLPGDIHFIQLLIKVIERNELTLGDQSLGHFVVDRIQSQVYWEGFAECIPQKSSWERLGNRDEIFLFHKLEQKHDTFSFLPLLRKDLKRDIWAVVSVVMNISEVFYPHH